MTLFAGHPPAMLTDIYIEALLVDEDLADQVWEAWDKGEIDDQANVAPSFPHSGQTITVFFPVVPLIKNKA